MDPTTYPLQDSTVCTPVIGAIGTVASAAGSFASQSAATSASNEAAINNYEYQVAQRENNWMQELTAWGHKRAEYSATVFENQVGLNKGYAAEQQRLNEIYNQAAFTNQDAMIKTLQNSGGNYASGATGKSAQRSNNMILAEMGRSQAATAASLVSAQQAYRSNTDQLRDQAISANNQAYSQVALKPVAGVAPPAPVLESGPSPLGLIGSVISAGAGAVSGMQANQPTPGYTGNTPAPTTPATFQQAPTSFSNPSWTPISTLSPTFYSANPYAY